MGTPEKHSAHNNIIIFTSCGATMQSFEEGNSDIVKGNDNWPHNETMNLQTIYSSGFTLLQMTWLKGSVYNFSGTCCQLHK